MKGPKRTQYRIARWTSLNTIHSSNNVVARTAPNRNSPTGRGETIKIAPHPPRWFNWILLWRSTRVISELIQKAIPGPWFISSCYFLAIMKLVSSAADWPSVVCCRLISLKLIALPPTPRPAVYPRWTARYVLKCESRDSARIYCKYEC